MREIIMSADIILASQRLSEVFRGYDEFEAVKEAVKVINNVDETIEYMKSAISGSQSVTISFLASGDPLFFGIGRRIVKEFGRDMVELSPDLSSVQVAFARIREPWDDAFLMSIHGGPDPKKRRMPAYKVKDIPYLLELHDKIAVLTDRVNDPSGISKEILKSSVGTGSTIYVCERLGYAEEKVIAGTPEEIAGRTFSDPNVVIIIREKDSSLPFPLNGPAPGGSASAENPSSKNDSGQAAMAETQPECSLASESISSFGLTEIDIHHSRGLITKDEIRAVTIHKLRLPEKGVLWDIGAGSGSVSVEAARLCPGLDIFAIEKEEEQIDNIRTNCRRFRVQNVKAHYGKAPEALEGLPSPRRVFIGGSGGRLDEIIDLIGRTMPAGIVVLNAATLETLHEAIASLDKNGFEVGISEVSVSRSKTVAGKRHLTALNPVFIITGEKGV